MTGTKRTAVLGGTAAVLIVAAGLLWYDGCGVIRHVIQHPITGERLTIMNRSLISSEWVSIYRGRVLSPSLTRQDPIEGYGSSFTIAHDSTRWVLINFNRAEGDTADTSGVEFVELPNRDHQRLGSAENLLWRFGRPVEPAP